MAPSELYAALAAAAPVASFVLCAAVRVVQLRAWPVRPRSNASKAFLATKLLAIAVALVASVLDVAFTLAKDGARQLSLVAWLLPPALALALVLTVLNHTRTRRSSTILLVFWPVSLGFFLSWLYSAVDANWHTTHTLLFSLRLTIAVAGLVAFALELIGPGVGSLDGYEEIGKQSNESPYITANVYSRLSFGWMTPLMKIGYSRYITQQDMFDLLPEDQSAQLGNKLEHHWQTELTKKSPSLWRALAKSYGGLFAFAAFLKLIQDLLAFAQPQLLRFLLSFISAYQVDSSIGITRGFALAILMFAAAIVQTAILHQYFQFCYVTGMRVRAGLVTTIYRKALTLSSDGQASRGDIVNIMSVDASRMQDLCTYALIVISGPFQIILAFTSLYQILGFPAFVGVLIMIFSIPMNTLLARFLKKLQEKQMKNKDRRTGMMRELLNNIKSVKLYAWEGSFIQRILAVRNDQEMVMLRKIGIFTALSNVIWSAVPLVVAFASFATAAYTSSTPLTSDVIFPCISLFMLLQFPLAMFSSITSQIIQSLVAVNRISTFLHSDELQPDARQFIEPRNGLNEGDTVLSIRDGEFRWAAKAVTPTIEGINLEVRKGELVAVLGRVGAGKSSLLAAINGEMVKSEGQVDVYGSIAYAPQNPWIMSNSVRDNILFFHEYDEEFYERVLDACALRPDLALLPQGDMTEVGEKGITLSGGQRARISLARCVYARSDLYLLDDVLAAVDAHVARHLFDHVIGPNGLLAGKARILITNSVAFLRYHQRIMLIRRGIILESSTYDEILQDTQSELYKLLTGHATPLAASRSASGSATPIVYDEDQTVVPDDSSIGRASDSLTPLDEKKGRIDYRSAVPTTTQRQTQQFNESQLQMSNGMLKEKSEQGKVKWSVYLEYLSSSSRIGVALFLLSIVSQQAATILGNFTLRDWAEHNRKEGENSNAFRYIAMYGAFVLSSSLASGAASILLLVVCSIRSSKRLHDGMLFAVVRAPLNWFEQTPQGRILNLFSKDVNVVDEVLARVFSGFFRTLASVLGILVVIGTSFPLFLAAVVPLAYLYQRVMRYYLATSRELKRLDAVSRSPIFAWFQESLGGLSTIRAFRWQQVFIHINELRSDTNLQCYHLAMSVNRWLAVRLEVMGASIVLFTAVSSVVALKLSGRVDSGLVGLVLSYALSTTGSLNWVVRSASEVEQNIVSVERILSYHKLEPEAAAEIPEREPASSWPEHGAISFKNYSVRYRPELDLVLRNINLDIGAGERIGVCGRTGAGKSSLLLSLMRIIEPASGTITVDGVDITQIGLNNVRTAISIIPQEPQLFEGTVRENVDPTGSHEDTEIWTALEQAHLKDFISLQGGLDAEVREGGSSLSSGQRQLICFARALLRKTKILVVDEGTSAVDLETERAIQDILEGPQFAGVTMITIAHRLQTIISSSTRILVLDAGKVTEFDSPDNLLAKSDSVFYSLAAEAGLAGTQ